MTTTQEQLDSVQAMIATIEGGAQSFSIKDRSTNLPSLETLYEREKYLQRKLTRESRGGGILVTGGTPT